MNNWYNAVTENPDDLSLLPDAIEYFENELEQAQTDLEIKGPFQKLAGELPGIMTHRFGQLQELEAILEFIDMKREVEKTKAFKKYLEGYSRSLTSRDAEKYANAEKSVFELSMLYNQINLLKQKYIGVTKGLETKHFQLSNLSKLKAAGLEDYIIS